MKFDINAARSAGYSDDEIADYLATENKFDLGGALQSGYSASEVIDFLSAPKGGKQELPADVMPSEGRSATPMGQADPRLIDNRGIIQRVADYLKPAPKSVMEGYQPSEQELQAERDRRLSYGAGPISSQTAAQADIVRSGMAKPESRVVQKVAKAMDEQGAPSFGDLVERAKAVPMPEQEQGFFERLAKETDYLGSSLERGWNGLKMAVNGQKLADYGELLDSFDKAYTPEQIASDPKLQAERKLREENFLKLAEENAQLTKENEAILKSDRTRPETKQMFGVGADKRGWLDAAAQIGKAIVKDPGSVVDLAISSGPATLASAAAATLTYFGTRNPKLAAAAGGAGSGYIEFGNEYAENRADGMSHEEAWKAATLKAGVVGALDAVSMNTAGKALDAVVEAIQHGATKTAIKTVGKETGRQAALGAGGEAGGALAAGKEIDPTSVMLEAVGETVSAPVEAVSTRGSLAKSITPGAQVARAMDQEIANTEFSVPAREVAADLLSPNAYDQRLISPAETARPSQIVNFTEPDSATAQAGLTPIVVPVPTATETTDVSTTGIAGRATAAGGQLAGDLGVPGVGDAGLTRVDATGAAGGGAGGLVPVGGEAAPVGDGAGQRAATVGLQRPLPRATDADLLARTEATVAAQEDNNAVAERLVEPWFGRKGGGYSTRGDAEQALPGRQRMYPNLQWRIDQMPNGRFMLGGYEVNTQETTLGTQTPQAQQATAQGQAPVTGAAGAGVGAPLAAGGITQAPAGVTPGVGELAVRPGAGPAEVGTLTTPEGAQSAGLKQPLRLAPPVPLRRAGRAIATLSQESGLNAELSSDPLTPKQQAGSAVARLLGLNFAVVKGDPAALPNGFVIPDISKKDVYVAADADDAPLSIVVHEGYHLLPDDLKVKVKSAIGTIFREEKRDQFAAQFSYDKNNKELMDEEIGAFLSQAVSRRQDFLEKLQQQLGDKDFIAVIGSILTKLKEVVAGAKQEYGDAFLSEYVKDIPAAVDLLSGVYAEAMNRQQQGTQPGGVAASNRTAEPEIGAKLRERIDTDYQGALQEYEALKGAKGGRVLDSDIARELSPEYRADRSRAPEVHEAVSDFIQRRFEERMAEPSQGDIVAFMAGGGGSGKSSAESLLAPILDRASTVFDGTLSTYEKAERNVQMALDSGRRVAIAYVYRDPVDALVNGVLTRAKRTGRAVPIDALVKGHAGSSAVVRKLQEKFGSNPNFKLHVVDNSLGMGNAKRVKDINDITPVIMDGLKERLINATEQQLQAGQIDDKLYRATVGRQADAGAAAQGEAGVGEIQQGSGSDAGQGRQLGESGNQVIQYSSRAKKAGSYSYTVDDKGRITVAGDVDRIRFLTKTAAKGIPNTDGTAVTFKAAEADAAIKALKNEPKADPEIAAAIKKQLDLSDEELASTSLEYQTGEPKDRAFVAPLKGGVPETVQFLEERRRASGLRLLDIAKDEDQDTLARLIAAETMAAIRSSGNALEWYDETIAKTLAMAGVKYPELSRDVNAQAAFRMGMAIASQGLNVENNLKLAMRQYEAFRNTGKFPEIGEGESAEAMAGNFRLANELMAEMGPDLFRRFLATPFTIGELNSAGFDPGGELVDEEVLGSSVFGPKIGFGFYSNLNGNFEPVTMDMWFMRTMGRLTGYLRAFDAEKFGGQLKRFRLSFGERGTDGVYADQFDADLVNAARTDEDSAIALARQVKKAHEKDFKANREAFDSKQRKKTMLVLSAETMIQSIDKPKDVPGNGTERRQMRQVVRKAVDLVEQAYGQRVPPAAMQALIWYPEQELYKALGVKLSVTSQDYAGATEKVLKEEGYDEQQLRAAAKSGARRVRQANARDERRAAQGDGQKAGRSGSLEGAERDEFVRTRYERFQLEKERLNPTRKGVIFEVAPDPNNEDLTNRWRSLNQAQRLDISARVAREIVPKVLTQFSSSGIVTNQVGSYLDDTNPSFTVLLDKGDAVEIAKQLGFVLAQDSMMVVSPKAFKGGEKVGAIAIELGDKTPAEVDQLYQNLREIEVNGEKPIAGQSMANGVMTILNYSKVPNQQLAILVDQKLNKRYTVMTREVFAAFPEKKEYDYARETDDGRGSRADLRKGARALRTEATAALERELAGVSVRRSNRAAGPAEPARGPGARPDARDGSTVTGIHYGKQAGLSSLSGTAFGSGIKGAEQARLAEPGVDPRIKKRVYFYLTTSSTDMPRPEIGLGSHVYRASLGNMYDPSKATPAAAKRVKDLMQGVGPNAFESAVLDAGYRGYVNREQGTAVVLNADVPVAYEGLAEAGRMRDRVIQRVQQGPVTRTEGDELVRKPTNDEMLGIIKARPALTTAAPSFKLQFGDARVLASEAAAADRVLAQAGAGFRFNAEDVNSPFTVMRSNRAQTDTLAFKRWFGDSKVVNADGTPLVVYHGTDADDNFSVFDTLDFGSWFAENEYTANGYTQKAGGAGSRIIPAYLKIEMPLRIPEDIDLSDDVTVEEALNRINDENGTTFEPSDIDFDPDYEGSAFEFLANDAFIGLAKRSGFDGIHALEGGEWTWNAFYPEQIKSAIGNQGTFDPENPDIRKSNRVKSDAEIVGMFKDLQDARGLKAVRVKERVAEHPMGEEIVKIHNDFYDILERLDEGGLIKINCK